MSFVVAVDGPAGSGKGTITKQVGEKLGLLNIDTGAMYRCVTLYMLNNQIDVEDKDRIEKMLNEIDIQLEKESIYLNGEDVTNKIRTKEVNGYISKVSKVKEIRNKVDTIFREIAKNNNVIMEGRDIGTTVFPNAEVKIYLDATAEERAKRRLKQNEEQGIESSYEEILQSIKYRDYNDKTREIAPLRQAEDAIYIDSTNMTIDEVVKEITRIINKVEK